MNHTLMLLALFAGLSLTACNKDKDASLPADGGGSPNPVVELGDQSPSMPPEKTGIETMPSETGDENMQTQPILPEGDGQIVVPPPVTTPTTPTTPATNPSPSTLPVPTTPPAVDMPADIVPPSNNAPASSVTPTN